MMPNLLNNNFGMGMNNNFMPNMMMNNNLMPNENEEWLKGFQFGIKEVNNINEEDSNPEPKINLTFNTTQGIKNIMVFNYGTTIDQILKKISTKNR